MAGEGKVAVRGSSDTPNTLYDGISPEVPENNEATIASVWILSAKWGKGTKLDRSRRNSGKTSCFLTPYSRLLHHKNEGDSGDVYENKGGRKQVPDVRCQVSEIMSGVRSSKSDARTDQSVSSDILSPDCLLLSSHPTKMKVTPEMCMKTKEGENRCRVSGARCQRKCLESGVRSPKSKTQTCPVRPFCLLSPDSCLLQHKNEGVSGDIIENKGRVFHRPILLAGTLPNSKARDTLAKETCPQSRAVGISRKEYHSRFDEYKPGVNG